MGLLVEGKWVDRWYDTKKTGGAFVRKPATFRQWIGEEAFPAEANRYHLYVSYACPWAHRTLIMRGLKGLEDIISFSVVEPLMLANGWELAPGSDPLHQASYLYEVYLKADANFTGRVTVPILWDKQSGTIVSNESSEIIRMFNREFEAFSNNPTDYYPEALQEEIDAINEVVYHDINNGVYKAGFATSQEVYEGAVTELFDALNRIEETLSKQRYLVGDIFTEADIRLFTTLVRFDPVYHGHFKCNIRMLKEYPNIYNYMKEIYQIPAITTTVHMDHIKDHYYGSHKTINPTGIVPTGPQLDLESDHQRDKVALCS